MESRKHNKYSTAFHTFDGIQISCDQCLSFFSEVTYQYGGAENPLFPFGTHSYTYGNTDWKDLLTAFDGETITYDASGNPLSYYNGTRWTFSWNNGRRLSKAVSSGTTVDYAYNLDGLRTGKTVDGVYHNYLYAGGKLMRETYGSNTLDFFYDANGTPYALKYNGAVYYYITNLQGDVTYLVSANGTPAATYEYDPYGNVITATGTLAQINPLRYRGYYYDNETGMYYLQSRYYDPAVGRFINTDNIAYLGADGRPLSYNLFAYCTNNCVNCSDSSGHFGLLSFLGSVVGGAIGGVAISTVSYIVGSALSGQEVTRAGLINAVATGAVSGALGGAIETIALATKVATKVVEGIASVGLGIAMGFKVGAETEGSTFKRVTTGIFTGIFTSAATFFGAQIDTGGFGFAGAAFTNYAATLFVGTPAEIASVASQQVISRVDKSIQSAKVKTYAHASSISNKFPVAMIY